MTGRIESLLEPAKAWSVEEQAQLLAEPHDLVSPPDPEWETAWADECERRMAAFERGETTAEDAAVAMTCLRAKYLVGSSCASCSKRSRRSTRPRVTTYYAREAPGVVAGFFAEVDRALERMSERPLAYASIDRRIRACIMNRFPYTLIYEAGESEVIVHAFAHQRRRPEYWRGREPEQ